MPLTLNFYNIKINQQKTKKNKNYKSIYQCVSNHITVSSILLTNTNVKINYRRINIHNFGHFNSQNVYPEQRKNSNLLPI